MTPDEPDDRKMLLKAMRWTSCEWRLMNKLLRVRLDFIMAQGWDEFRLTRATDKLARGLVPPPVKLVIFRCGKLCIFEPSDGNHRVCAARAAGHTDITAIVGGEWLCHPDRCIVRGNKLTVSNADGTPRLPETVSGQMVATLGRLGVRIEPDR